jgi:hypothetical protein
LFNSILVRPNEVAGPAVSSFASCRASSSSDAGRRCRARATMRLCADFRGLLREKNWCCQTGLNCRPLHYQWSALPLSYGSMPGTRIGRNGPYRRADPCHKAPARASARTACPAIKNGQNQRGRAGGRLPLAQLRADPVPDFVGERRQRLDRADHDLEFGSPGDRRLHDRRAGHTIYPSIIAALVKARRIRTDPRMTNDRDKAEGREGHLAKKDARRDQLKEALRENLKRRKSQARGRNDIAPAPSHGETAAPHDGGGEKPGE